MIYKIQFSTEEEKDKIINENSEKFLIQVDRLLTGNFLSFSDLPTLEILQQEQGNKISILEQQNSQLETALVELASIVGGA